MMELSKIKAREKDKIQWDLLHIKRDRETRMAAW